MAFSFIFFLSSCESGRAMATGRGPTHTSAKTQVMLRMAIEVVLPAVESQPEGQVTYKSWTSQIGPHELVREGGTHRDTTRKQRNTDMMLTLIGPRSRRLRTVLCTRWFAGPH